MPDPLPEDAFPDLEQAPTGAFGAQFGHSRRSCPLRHPNPFGIGPFRSTRP